MLHRIETLLNELLERKISAISWVLVFLGVLYLRCFIEQFIARSRGLALEETIVEFIQNLYFFLLTLVLVWIFTSLVIRINPKRLAFIMACASFLMILPPVLDMAKTGGEVYWSFYMVGSLRDLWLQFITVFGHFPSGIIYFGTKITFILAIIFVAMFIGLKTKKVMMALVGAFGTYLVVFFMGSFPTLLSMVYFALSGTRKLSEVQSFHVVQFLGTPQMIWGINFPSFRYSLPYNLDFFYFPFLILMLTILFYLISKEKLWAVIKNFRYPQLIYHAGLFFIGMGLGYLNYPDNFHFHVFSVFAVFTLIISIWLSWKASVIVNDLEDLEIDKVSNPNRPLPSGVFSEKDYKQLGIICFLLALLGGLTVGLKFFFLLLTYQIIAWIYSASPFRLKKFPVVATLVSAMASLTIMFMGYILMSSDQSIYNLSWRITLLLLISYTISLPIKDFKDIQGDGKCHIWTIPVIFGEKNSRLIVAVSIFTSYMLSVFFLNELRLFWWALSFGIISFFILNSSRIDPRRLPWWFLGTISVYMLIMVKIVFIDNLSHFIRIQ